MIRAVNIRSLPDVLVLTRATTPSQQSMSIATETEVPEEDRDTAGAVHAFLSHKRWLCFSRAEDRGVLTGPAH